MRRAIEMSDAAPAYIRRLELADETETLRLADELAVNALPGDLILLSGDLGAGKTTLARAIIRAIAEDEALEVPSPTFTLVQSYSLPRLTVHHLDLYRISSPQELDELGIGDALADGVVLVEWPERAPASWPDDRLEVALALDPAAPARRQARLAGHGGWALRLARMDAARRFLRRQGYDAWRRRFLQGDASKRRYERLSGNGRKALLMDAPPMPDPGVGQVPYSRLAHLAEDVVPFVAIAGALRANGLSAPEIAAADLDAGFLVVEDLGSDAIVDGDRQPIRERYEAAIDVLVHLHGLSLPGVVEAAPGRLHRLPPYDIGAFMAEAALLLDWFAPHLLGRRLPAEAEERFRSLWRQLLEPLSSREGGRWVLRDFHSPNLLWLANRKGPARIGLLDFQDALIGPPAYDVASLAMDARVDIAPELENALAKRYATARRTVDAAFDADAFAAEFALMAAHRNTKILGIFARLDRRDGKAGYLAHVPRISGYLDRALAHPALAPLKAWYDAHLPAGLRECHAAERQGR